MVYIVTNLGPILAATVLGLLLGAVYRSVVRPVDGIGARPIPMLAVAFVAEFWLAAILAGALILAPVQVDPWVVAIGSAVVIWIGFVVPSLVVSYAARGLGAGAIFGDCTHWLVVMAGQAAVLNAVGLKRP